MIRIISSALILLSVTLSYSLSMAEEANIPVSPGLYTVTVTSSSDKSSSTAKKVVDICINKELLDPVDFLPKAADCSLANVKKDGRKASFDIGCKGGGGDETRLPVPAMKGAGECSTTESELSCNYKMEGEIQGEVFKVNTKRKGSRIGDCPE